MRTSAFYSLQFLTANETEEGCGGGVEEGVADKEGAEGVGKRA